MHGNVWEWCQDGYDAAYYGNSPAADPQGPANGAFRVVRGGSWFSFPHVARSANRNYLGPPGADNGHGLRVVAAQ